MTDVGPSCRKGGWNLLRQEKSLQGNTLQVSPGHLWVIKGNLIFIFIFILLVFQLLIF